MARLDRMFPTAALVLAVAGCTSTSEDPTIRAVFSPGTLTKTSARATS
jgi:hypothetical protein